MKTSSIIFASVLLTIGMTLLSLAAITTMKEINTLETELATAQADLEAKQAELLESEAKIADQAITLENKRNELDQYIVSNADMRQEIELLYCDTPYTGPIEPLDIQHIVDGLDNYLIFQNNFLLDGYEWNYYYTDTNDVWISAWSSDGFGANFSIHIDLAGTIVSIYSVDLGCMVPLTERAVGDI